MHKKNNFFPVLAFVGQVLHVGYNHLVRDATDIHTHSGWNHVIVHDLLSASNLVTTLCLPCSNTKNQHLPQLAVARNNPWEMVCPCVCTICLQLWKDAAFKNFSPIGKESIMDLSNVMRSICSSLFDQATKSQKLQL